MNFDTYHSGRGHRGNRRGRGFEGRGELTGRCGEGREGRGMRGMGAGRGHARGGGRGRGGFDRPDDDFGAGFGDGGGRGGRGGGRRRLFDNAGLRLLLLHLTAQEPRHGYDLIREIETLSGGAYIPSPGMIYPALTMMAEMDHIAEQASEGTRKRFAITPEGEAFLTENAGERDAVLARLAVLAQQAAPVADHAPVRRAMENLKAALRIRLHKEGSDGDTIFDVAALIDEAASRIERLK
ncbi:MAG: PadR family transcriptional regulator [Sphingobium sp.]